MLVDFDFGPFAATGFFLFGLAVGSFLNVVSYRLPREESIVWPGSHCAACAKPIAWYDNIPLVSWLALAGKCRSCRARISVRYFLGELACGLIWLGSWLYYGAQPQLVAGLLFFSMLLTVTFTDFETGYIPDKITLPGMAAGLVLSAVFPELHGTSLWYRGLLDGVFGLLAGGGILYVVGWIGDKVFRKETMGGGDIKLLALLGVFLGPAKAGFVFLLAPLAAIPFALYMKYVKRSETIPYGPFLALTGALFFIWGEGIVKFILETYGVY